MTLIAAYDPNNIFAKIIRGEIPAIKIHEDDDTLAFMDIFPQTEGHALVIPKLAQATSLFDASPEALETLIVAVQKIAKAVEAALKPDGMRIMQFNGSEAGQTVFHIHFHIVPIYAGQQARAHAGGAPADQARLKELAQRIAAAL
ncbi:MAG: HIT family protein [Parvularculaceae bacterium]